MKKHFKKLLSVALGIVVLVPAVAFGSTLPSNPALVDTNLASGIGTADTSMTLANGKTVDNTSLSGFMCFTIDVNTPSLEYVCGTASGTSVTGLTRGLGFWNPNIASSSLGFVHRRFATVQSTDYPALQLITRNLQGIDAIGATLFYGGHPTSSASTTIEDKAYIDNTASAGAPAADTGTAGIVILATPAQTASGTATATYNAGTYKLVPANTSFSKTATSSSPVVVVAQGAIDSSFMPSTLALSTNTSTAPSSTDTLNILPAGIVQEYAGATSTVPAGWLICDGSAYASTTYPRLFSTIGYTYGSSTGNFLVPNLKGNVVIGLNTSNASTSVIGQTGGATSTAILQTNLPSLIPTLNGTPQVLGGSGGTAAFSSVGQNGGSGFSFNQIGGSSTPLTNLPPYVVMQYIIKY